MKTVGIALALLAGAVCVRSVGAQRITPPAVSVRIDGNPWVAPGETQTVRYSTEGDTYVAVLQLDVDGEVTVLAPAWPRRSMRASSSDERSVWFRAGPSDGTGAVFVVASRRPLNLALLRGDDGEMRRVVAPIDAAGDEGLWRVARIIAGGQASYGMEYARYYVGRNGALGEPVGSDTYDGDWSYNNFGGNVVGVYRGRSWDRECDPDDLCDLPQYGGGVRGRFLRHCADGNLGFVDARSGFFGRHHGTFRQHHEVFGRRPEAFSRRRMTIRRPMPVPHMPHGGGRQGGGHGGGRISLPQGFPR